jgi:hypothetical protein
MKPLVKTEVIAVRVEPELKRKAEKMAAKDRRTMSSWVEVLIAREVAANPPPRGRKAREPVTDQHRAA